MAKASLDQPMKSSNKRMSRLREIEALAHPASNLKSPLHSLIWGRVKAGKTAFIASGPKPIIFACEEGTKTVRDFPDLTVYPQTAEGLWVPPKWKHASDFVYMLRYGDHDYKTVGVDTMSALLRIAMRLIRKDEEARDEFRPKGSMTQPDWGRVASLMTQFMEDLETVCKSRGMHLVYTCHERTLSDDKAELEGSYFVPDLPPSVRGPILEKPDLIARVFIEEDDEADIDKTALKYGMTFKHPEWPVGVRETVLKGAAKPLPATAFNVTIPKLTKRLGINI